MPILEAHGLTKTYRLGEEKVVGVVDASLTLEKQSFAVLAGPSGSGKTTLLNLLGLLDTPETGTLYFEGVDVATLDERGRARLRRERLGFVFQAHQLVPVLSAEENVALALWIRRLPEETCRARARAALAAVGLARPRGAGGPTRSPAGSASGSRSPARSWASRRSSSRTSRRRPSTRRRRAAFSTSSRASTRSAGVAFLFSSHDPRIVERADRRIRLSDGRITADERVAAGARA